MNKFTLQCLLLLLPLYICAGYYNFFVKPELDGDLGNLGCVDFGKGYCDSLEHFYPKKLMVEDSIDESQNKIFEVVSIGDSFSQKGYFGYQNYLAVLRNKSIFNYVLSVIPYSPEQSAIESLNSGVFKKLKTKVVIVESVERDFIYRLNQIDFDSKCSVNPLIFPVKERLPVKAKPFLEGMCSWIRLSMGINNAVKRVTLNGNYFKHKKYGNQLFFYDADLSFAKNSPESIKSAKLNLIKLNDYFIKRGVKLIYMVAVDKYDLYQTFISNKTYSENKTLDEFQDLNNSLFFLNTKHALLPLILDGNKDIFMVNDTHWSFRGSEQVALQINDRMNKMHLK